MIKIGDKVKLNEKAIRSYYGKGEYIDGFFVGGELTTEHFTEFVEHYLGFDNGKNFGIVVGYGHKSLRVEFQTPLGAKQHSYYGEKELKRISK